MFQWIHCADLHLDSPLRGLIRYPGIPAERARLATRQAVVRLVDLALTIEASLVVIAGDLFDDDWRDYRSGLFLHHQLSRLREAGVWVAMVRGNHDAVSQVSRALRFPDNVKMFPADRAETWIPGELGVAIHGRSYPRREVREDLTAGYPPPVAGLCNVGVLHTALTGCEGHEPYAPCSLATLTHAGYDYWALGHVHQRRIVAREPWVVFAGNPQGRHIRESGEKGCYVVSVEGTRVEEVVFHPLDGLRWRTLSLEVPVDDPAEEVFSLLARRLAELERGVVVRLTVTGGGRAYSEWQRDPVRWQGELRGVALEYGGGEVWLEKILFQSYPEVDLVGQGELQEAIAAVLAEEAALAELIKEFEPLKRRLPAVVWQGLDGVDPEDPVLIRRWLRQLAVAGGDG